MQRRKSALARWSMRPLPQRPAPLPPGPWPTRIRLAIGFAGLLVMISGVGTLLRGQLHYPNYWGGAVFAPFALIIGALVILAAIVRGRRK